MPPEPQSPWSDFLREVDKQLSERVDLHCIGGFALAVQHGLPRPTSDVDYVSAIPTAQVANLERIAGLASELARKHGVCLQYVGVATLPEGYEDRLVELFPGLLEHLGLWVPDPYDLVLSKLERNSPKDREDVAYLAKHVPLDSGVLRARYREELRPNLLVRQEWHDQTLDMWSTSYFDHRVPESGSG